MQKFVFKVKVMMYNLAEVHEDVGKSPNHYYPSGKAPEMWRVNSLSSGTETLDRVVKG